MVNGISGFMDIFHVDIDAFLEDKLFKLEMNQEYLSCMMRFLCDERS